MTHIIFVKKILTNGEPCKKCSEVSERLVDDGLMQSINHIAIADQRDPESEGMRLARKHNIERAPFFIVESDSEEVLVFDVYFKLKSYLSKHSSADVTSSTL